MSDFCRNCGAPLGTSRFCPSCGHPHLADTTGETPTSAVPGTSTSAMSGTMRGLLIGGAVVLVALALVVVAALFFWTRDDGAVTTVVAPSTAPTVPAPTPATPTPTVTTTATATVTAVAPPVAPVQPAFSGCPSGFAYVGNYGGYDVCRNGSISDGFAINIAEVVSGPGSYSGVYSPARDKGYYFTCVAVGSGVVDCGYPPTNIANGGLVRLYP